MNDLTVFGCGRLTQTPELKTYGSTNVVRVGLAVDRWDAKNKKADVNFFNIVFFGKNAEFICNNGYKGLMVTIRGRLSVDSYTDRNGNKRNNVEILVDDMFMPRRQSDNAASPSVSGSEFYEAPNSTAAEVTDDELPF